MQALDDPTHSTVTETSAGTARRIVLLNQAFYPDVVSTAQHATDLALALAGAGHHVTAVASARGYDDPARRFPARETYRGIEIVRVGATSFGKTARWRRTLDFASFWIHCAVRVLFLRRADVVIALTSPPLISFLGSLMVPLKARALLFWAMDLNPDEAIAAGWLRERSFSARLLARLQTSSMRRARRIVALDRFMRERLLAKGLPEAKIAVIPPWAHDPVRFDAAGRENFRRQHGLQNKFVVMYSGNHSPCHPLDTLVDAAVRLADDERFVFLFVGGGSEYRKLQAMAGQKQMRNLRFLPYQPLDAIAESLSAADLHVVVMGEPFVGIVHPCKIYNVLRVGAAILYIGPSASHIADIVPQLGASAEVYLAGHGDADAVSRAILRAAESSHRANLAHMAAAQQFGHDALVSKMVSEVEAVCNSLRPAPATAPPS